MRSGLDRVLRQIIRQCREPRAFRRGNATRLQAVHFCKRVSELRVVSLYSTTYLSSRLRVRPHIDIEPQISGLSDHQGHTTFSSDCGRVFNHLSVDNLGPEWLLGLAAMTMIDHHQRYEADNADASLCLDSLPSQDGRGQCQACG